MEEWVKILLGFLGGGVGVALINALHNRADFKRRRKAEKEDREELNVEQEIRELKQQLAAIRDGMKFVLYDRIRFLGQAYIAAGEIDFDDRRILNAMHKVYHNGLDGNGDLDGLMGEVNHLPLKKG